MYASFSYKTPNPNNSEAFIKEGKRPKYIEIYSEAKGIFKVAYIYLTFECFQPSKISIQAEF